RAAVAASQVAPSDGFLFARLEVYEGVQPRGPTVPLLGEPDLVAAEKAIADGVPEKRGIVGVEDELRSTGVREWILEQSHQLGNECWVKARVEVVGEEHGSRLKGVDHWPDQAEPDASPQRLVFGIELDVAVGAPVGESNAELLERRAVVA